MTLAGDPRILLICEAIRRCHLGNLLVVVNVVEWLNIILDLDLCMVMVKMCLRR